MSGRARRSPNVVPQGRARITRRGALEVMDHLAQYLGPGQQYPTWTTVPEGVVVHVIVERIYALRPWMEEAGVEAFPGVFLGVERDHYAGVAAQALQLLLPPRGRSL